MEGCFPGWDKSNASKSNTSDRGRHGAEVMVGNTMVVVVTDATNL